MKEATRYVIAGGSAAGMAAAQAIAEADPGGSITIFSDEKVRPYFRPMIPFVISGTKKLDDILLEGRGPYRVGGMEVRAFAVPHDAVDPVGFVCTEGGVRFGVATDLGHVTGLVREELKGVQGLFLEANYDQGLLDADTRRPWPTKQRIASRHGHLSNGQAAELVELLIGHGLEQVVLGHLSGDCNCPKVVSAAVRRVAGDLPVHIASQEDPSPWVEVEVRRPTDIPALVPGSGGQGLLF